MKFTRVQIDVYCVLLFFIDDAIDTHFEAKKPSSLRDIRYEEACNRLAVEAVKRGCTDNVTVMIVDIAPREKGEDPVFKNSQLTTET